MGTFVQSSSNNILIDNYPYGVKLNGTDLTSSGKKGHFGATKEIKKPVDYGGELLWVGDTTRYWGQIKISHVLGWGQRY